MEDTKKVHGMKLELKTRTDGSKYYQGDHPFGGLVHFYTYKSTDIKKQVTEKWIWSYNGADSSNHKSLDDAVEDWRYTVGIA